MLNPEEAGGKWQRRADTMVPSAILVCNRFAKRVIDRVHTGALSSPSSLKGDPSPDALLEVDRARTTQVACMPCRSLAPVPAVDEAASAQALLLSLSGLGHVVLLEDEGSLAAVRMAVHRLLMGSALDFGPVPLRHGWGREARRKSVSSKGCQTSHM
jgi:hypothetical protein